MSRTDIERIDKLNTVSKLREESKETLRNYCLAKNWRIPVGINKNELVNFIKKENKIDYRMASAQKTLERNELVNKIICQSSNFNPIPEIMAKLECLEPEAKKLYDTEVGKSSDRIQEEINRKIHLEIDPQIRADIEEEMIECLECGKKNFGKTSVDRWLDKFYCLDCHYKLFSEAICQRWKEFQEWKMENNLDKCFMGCGSQGRHFDHTNIFDKCQSFDADTSGLSKMIQRGYPMELIYQEIKEKTVPLCVSCHNIITKLENKYLLTRLKSRITKECKEGGGDDAFRQESVLKNKDQYADLCQSFYQFVKGTINKV